MKKEHCIQLDGELLNLDMFHFQVAQC